ncbi:tripartite tricarboxylate transporter TctB family protein [Microbacterium azadirachtae]|uniref:Tripartite tricarboxylate transporter TctB family protein n=1 Tax=Microbacterium azadirachtae TaxID=582680 RepID=A0A0F0KQR6_9MICO|nr:tripartite tricarboxylate transporter TctB family protein [Microbacterium azadirachtae]KJL23247.1 Tripartite tricarboxylate transporter TctB family protein [Microbacterium azadirachtae]UXW86693.1 tripartite tricarboxylate transporter TctB family protein [Microbacterium azadirachtae]SDM39926.1 putative tricarboxylic transport membrane protein [Microbacterium azadirachtae]SEG54871.1 putative tricarboxylic transport membrane protein [Microbacterium azadirachtae]SEG57766.1 putative tricarboxyli
MTTGTPGTDPSLVRVGEIRPARPSVPVGELVFALIMLGLGIFALVGVFGIRVPAGATVGPTVFPILVSAILLVASVAVLVGVLRGQRAQAEEGEDIDESLPTDWLTLAKITALVVAHLALLEYIGWAPAAALLFGGVAWSLGAKRWWLAFVIGAAVALVVQIVFGGLLGLSLPWGPLLGWLGGMF